MKRFLLLLGFAFLFIGLVYYIGFADEAFVPYENQENGFSFSYPAEWKVEPTEGFVFFAIGDDGLNVGVIRENGKGVDNISLSDFAREEKGYLENELKDFEELSLQDVTVNGQKAMLRIYQYKIKARKFKSLEYYIQGKKSGFVVVFDGPSVLFDKLKSIALKSIQTFKLIGDEAVPVSTVVKVPKVVGRNIKPIEEWKQFVNKDKGFKLSYPASWKTVTPYEDVVFEADSPEGYQFQVLNHNLGKTGTLKMYFRSTGRWLKKHLIDYNELSVKELDNGYERVYEFSQDNITAKVRELYFVKKDKKGTVWGFTLVFMAPKDKFDNAETYFGKIEKSFSLNIEEEEIPPKPEKTVTPPTPKPEKTIPLPTPKPEKTISLPTPKPEGTQTPIAPKVNKENVNPDDFILYKHPEGKFEVMIPKGLTLLEDDDEYVLYGDLSKGYIVGAGLGLLDTEEGKEVTIDYIMEALKKAPEEMDIEGTEIVEGPERYKDGAKMMIKIPKAPFPGMKDTVYYGVIFEKPKEGTDGLGVVIILPKDEYDAQKSKIDFIIDSLK